MSFLAKLFINGRKINVLDTNIQFYQSVSYNTFKPSSLPKGGIFTVTLEADSNTDLLSLVLARDTMCNGHIRFYKRDGMSKLTDYEFFDSYIVNYQRNFNGYSATTDTFVFSPGIIRIGDMVFEKPWKITDLNNLANNIPPQPITPKPKLSSVKWKTVDGESIEETTYKEKVALEVKVANAEGGSVEITIEKEDGTEFEEGTKSLTFTEYLTDEGTAQISTLKIKEEWNEFKTAEIDGLIAKVSHKGTKKESTVLQLVPPPKVIVDFRTSKKYDGEYGFDYMRDKKEKDDKLTYKDILGTNKSAKGVNTFTKYTTDTKYNELKCNFYDTINLDWHKNPDGSAYDFIQSWLTIYQGDTQTLSLQVETIENPKKLELTFEYDKTFFKLNTEKIPAQGKGKKRLDDHLTIECLKEFDVDQVIKVMYQKRQLGQLNVLKNDKVNRKKVDVLFVQVETKLKNKKKKVSITGENAFLDKYLTQAYIKPNIIEESLDLTADTIFNKTFDTKSNGYIDNRTGLHDYLNKKIDVKYKDYLKVYFIPDECPSFNKTGVKVGRINGQAKAISSDAVVLFDGHNTSTTTHESLHALGLYHTFSTNTKHPYSYKKGETFNIMDYSHQSIYGSKKRIMTWFWQWKKLWFNKLIKSE